MSTPERRCGKCKEPKPATLDYFHASPKGPTYLHHWCKVCMRKYIRDRAAAKKQAAQETKAAEAPTCD